MSVGYCRIWCQQGESSMFVVPRPRMLVERVQFALWEQSAVGRNLLSFIFYLPYLWIALLTAVIMFIHELEGTQSRLVISTILSSMHPDRQNSLQNSLLLLHLSALLYPALPWFINCLHNAISIVHSKLDYCNSLFYKLPKGRFFHRTLSFC